MTPCPACGRPAYLIPKRSIMDGIERDLCATCQACNCQPMAVVVRVVNSQGWKELPKWQRIAARVYHAEQYLPVRTWAKLMARQQITVYRGTATLDELAEEEAQLAHIVDAMKAVTRPPQITPTPRRFWRTAGQFALWCLGFSARSAA
jgi:hypothetical protein